MHHILELWKALGGGAPNRTTGAALCAKLDAAGAASWIEAPLVASDAAALIPRLLPCFPRQGVDALAAGPWPDARTACRFLIGAQAPCREYGTACDLLASRASELPGCTTLSATVTIDFDRELLVYVDNSPVQSKQDRELALPKSDRATYHLVVTRSDERVVDKDIPIVEDEKSSTSSAGSRSACAARARSSAGTGAVNDRRRSPSARPSKRSRCCSCRVTRSSSSSTRNTAMRRGAVDAAVATLTIGPFANGSLEEVLTACDGSESRIAAVSGPRRQETEVVLAAKPDTEHGFHLKTWRDMCSHAQDRCRFTMPAADSRISAEFVDQIEVALVVEDGVAREPVTHRVDRGDCHELVVKPKDATWNVEWTVSPKAELEDCPDPRKAPTCRCVRATADVTVTAKLVPPPPVKPLITSPDAPE